MDALHVWHLVVVFAWGGLVAGELALELSARDEAGARAVARAHAWIDLGVELPLLVAVLSTGVAVQLRHRAATAPAFARWDQRVKWTFAAAPFGLGAAWIGLAYFTP